MYLLSDSLERHRLSKAAAVHRRANSLSDVRMLSSSSPRTSITRTHAHIDRSEKPIARVELCRVSGPCASRRPSCSSTLVRSQRSFAQSVASNARQELREPAGTSEEVQLSVATCVKQV